MTSYEYHPNLRELTPNQYWLLQHQITAFWHGFGISNGIYISKQDLQEGRYMTGETWLRVTPERMRKELNDYVTWLESYKAKWKQKSSPEDVKRYRHGLQSFLEQESDNPERLEILRIISLLQNSACLEIDGSQKGGGW